MHRPGRHGGSRLAELERRWQQACEDITRATQALQALSGDSQNAEQLVELRERLAAARRRRIALAEEMENLEASVDDSEIWR